MKDERMRKGNIQWYLIILLLLCALRDKDPLFGYRKNTVLRLSEYNDSMSL
jgi:hypothetical protein